MPAARSQTTSASPMPCRSASSETRSHGRLASGRSSQRASSSASNAAASPAGGSSWSLINARRASRWESLSFTHHMPQNLLLEKQPRLEASPPGGRIGSGALFALAALFRAARARRGLLDRALEAGPRPFLATGVVIADANRLDAVLPHRLDAQRV